jgi:hypothetical protein
MLRSRLWLATFLVAACAACSDVGASPAPTDGPSSSTTPAPTAPTSSVPSDLAGYREQERVAYETAVTEYDAFTTRGDRFYAAGQTTVAAKRFFQRYSIDWSTAWGDLAVIANNITITGSTKTVWTKPKSIELGRAMRDVVVLRRCSDQSGWVVTQNGKKVDQPQFNHPHVYTVRLEKRRGENWWRSGTVKQGETC